VIISIPENKSTGGREKNTLRKGGAPVGKLPADLNAHRKKKRESTALRSGAGSLKSFLASWEKVKEGNFPWVPSSLQKKERRAQTYQNWVWSQSMPKKGKKGGEATIESRPT